MHLRLSEPRSLAVLTGALGLALAFGIAPAGAPHLGAAIVLGFLFTAVVLPRGAAAVAGLAVFFFATFTGWTSEAAAASLLLAAFACAARRPGWIKLLGLPVAAIGWYADPVAARCLLAGLGVLTVADGLGRARRGLWIPGLVALCFALGLPDGSSAPDAPTLLGVERVLDRLPEDEKLARLDAVGWAEGHLTLVEQGFFLDPEVFSEARMEELVHPIPPVRDPTGFPGLSRRLRTFTGTPALWGVTLACVPALVWGLREGAVFLRALLALGSLLVFPVGTLPVLAVFPWLTEPPERPRRVVHEALVVAAAVGVLAFLLPFRTVPPVRTHGLAEALHARGYKVLDWGGMGLADGGAGLDVIALDALQQQAWSRLQGWVGSEHVWEALPLVEDVVWLTRSDLAGEQRMVQLAWFLNHRAGENRVVPERLVESENVLPGIRLFRLRLAGPEKP